MKTGGIVVGIIGVSLFLWHLVRSNPNYEGYASHQVMSIDAVILIIVGTFLYIIGKRRLKRKSPSVEIRDDV